MELLEQEDVAQEKHKACRVRNRNGKLKPPHTCEIQNRYTDLCMYDLRL